MRIFDRILLACGIVVAIGAAQSTLVVWDLTQLSNRIVEMTTTPLLEVDSADRMAALFRNADQQLADATDAIHFVSSAEATAAFEDTLAAIKTEIARFSSAPIPSRTRRRLDRASRRLDQWAAEALTLLGERPATSIVTHGELDSEQSLIVGDLTALVEDALRSAEVAKTDMLGLAALSRRRSIVELIMMILASIGVSLTAAFSITRPMGRLKDTMALVAAGRLDTAIQDLKRRDELGSMSQALEVFRQQALNVRKLEQTERETREREAALEVARVADLQRRETSFHLLFRSNPVAMWVHDIHSGSFIAVNDAAVQHYGYSREQFLSMRTSDIGWVTDAKRDVTPINGGAQRHRKADGVEIEVSIYESFLEYEDRSALLTAIIDLTERHRAERRIRHLAHHDALTDLPNRFAFDEMFSSSLRSALDSL